MCNYSTFTDYIDGIAIIIISIFTSIDPIVYTEHSTSPGCQGNTLPMLIMYCSRIETCSVNSNVKLIYLL